MASDVHSGFGWPSAISSGSSLVLDAANDGGQERASGATTDELRDDGADVKISGYQARERQGFD